MTGKRGQHLAVFFILLVVFGVVLFLGIDFTPSITGLTFVEGNESTAVISGVSSFGVLVGGSPLNTSNYSGSLAVDFLDGSDILASFTWDFDNNVLNMSNVTVERTASGLSVGGVSVSKTFYVGKSSSNYVCIRDVDGASIASISSDCSDTSEVMILCDGSLQAGYTCSSFNSTAFVVSGLANSAVVSLPLDIIAVVLDVLGQGAFTDLNVSGIGFDSGFTAVFSDPEISVSNSSFINSTSLNITVYVGLNAAEGISSLVVTNPDGNFTSYGITIVEGPLNMSSLNIMPKYVTLNNLPTLFNLSVQTAPGVQKSTLNFTNSTLVVANSQITGGVINLSNVTDPPDVFYFTGYGTVTPSGTYDDNEFYTDVIQSWPCSSGCAKEQEGYLSNYIGAGPLLIDITGVTLPPAFVAVFGQMGNTVNVILTTSVVFGSVFAMTTVPTFIDISTTSGACVPNILMAVPPTPGLFVAVGDPDGITTFVCPDVTDTFTVDLVPPPLIGDFITFGSELELIPIIPVFIPRSGGGNRGSLPEDKNCVQTVADEADPCHVYRFSECLRPGTTFVVYQPTNLIFSGEIVDERGNDIQRENHVNINANGALRPVSAGTNTDPSGDYDKLVLNVNPQTVGQAVSGSPTSSAYPMTLTGFPLLKDVGGAYGKIQNPNTVTAAFELPDGPMVVSVNGVTITPDYVAGPGCPAPPTPEVPYGPCPSKCTVGTDGQPVFNLGVATDGGCDIVPITLEGTQMGFYVSVGGPPPSSAAMVAGSMIFGVPVEMENAQLAGVDEFAAVPTGFSGITGAAVAGQPPALGTGATYMPGPFGLPQFIQLPGVGGAAPGGVGGAALGGVLGIAGAIGNCLDPEPWDPGDPGLVPPCECVMNYMGCGCYLSVLSGGYFATYTMINNPVPCLPVPCPLPICWQCPPRTMRPAQWRPEGPGVNEKKHETAAWDCCGRCPYETKEECRDGVLVQVQEVSMVTASGGTMTPEAIARCGKKEQIIGSCSGCPTEDQLPAFCAQKQVKFALGRATPDEKSLIEECCPVVPLTCPDPAEEDCIPEGVPTFITTRSAIINDLGYQLPTVAAVKPASDVSLASDTSSIVGAAIFGAQVANILGSGSTYIGGQQGTHPIFIQTKWGVTVSSGVFNTPVFVGKQPPSTQTIPPLTSLPTSTPTTEVFTFVPAGCLGKRTCEVKNGQVVWSGCELPEGVSIQSCYPAPPKCGDGNVDEGEVCGEPGLTCTGSDVCINCACSPPPPTCGDGTVAPGEMCGEPGLPGCPIGTQCNSCVCSPNPLCGNGLVDPGEMCGESPFTPSCPPSFNCINCGCVPIPPGCGDGVLTSPETCEPGVVACSVGQVCNNCVCGLPPVFCGNGVLETGEACDDGNRNLCDGCSSSCTKEICGDRVVCPTQNEVCEPPSVGTCGSNCQPIASCGDGAITSPETCEPPNTATCGPTCVSIGCGNGVVDSGESCDDGNTASGDGCSSTCLIEKCGNNFVDSGEECDSPSSYCTTATINPGWCDQSVCKCKPAPPPLCGNGRVEALANEQCDPPSTGSCTTGNYCDTSCQCSPLPVCGNGKQEPGEMCDPAGSSCTDPLGRASTCNSACVCPAPTRPTTIIPGIPPIIFGCPGCTTITSTPTNPVATPTNSVPGNPIIRTPTTTLNPTTEPVKDTCAYGETDIKLERIESVDPSLLPKGAQFAFGLRALNSGKGVYDITAAISEAFGSDTEVVKCSKEDSGYLCSTYLGATTSFSSGCAGMSYNRLTYEQMGARKPTVEYAELPTFSEDFTTIAQEGKVFQQGKYVVELKENALLSIGPPSDILDQPQNPYSMIFTSLEVGIPEGVDSLTARVTLPLPRPIPSGIDKYSVRLFVWNRDHWLYIDAVPDLALGLVSAEIDLRAFAVNGKVLFAVIGTVCYACDQSKFDLVYDGGGEKAVVLVHGLTSNGIGTWAPMIKDIEAAKLPLQVYLFSYPTWWPMERVSEDLVVNLDSLSDKYKIFPVGHSVGGLIVQHALFTSYVRRLEDPSLFRYLDKVENGAVIVLGAPNKGSPVEDVWKSLYGYILKLKAPNAPFNLNAPLLHDAVNGRQIPPVPGIKYFIVAGTKPFEFNLGFFSITTEELLRLFTPNDGMIQVDSAYTLGSEEFNDLCDNYFEVHLDHIELNDHELARRIIERIITQQFRDAAPITQPMPGYSKYVNFKGQDWMTDDLFLIVGKTLPETERPSALTGCACGNGACGEDESPFICPTDCFISKVRTFCVAAPVWIYLLLALSVLVFIVHAVRGKKEHGRSHIILYILLGIALLLNLLMLLTCRSLSLLALFATLGIIIFVFLESRLRRHRGEHEPEGRQVIPEKTVPAPKTMPRPLFVPSKKPPKPLFVPTKPQSEKKPPKPEDSYDKTVKEAKRVLKRFKV